MTNTRLCYSDNKCEIVLEIIFKMSIIRIILPPPTWSILYQTTKTMAHDCVTSWHHARRRSSWRVSHRSSRGERVEQTSVTGRTLFKLLRLLRWPIRVDVEEPVDSFTVPLTWISSTGPVPTPAATAKIHRASRQRVSRVNEGVDSLLGCWQLSQANCIAAAMSC